MQSDSGRPLAEIPPVPEVTLDDAKALVDSWGDLNAEGFMSFRIHRVAETLRLEVARLEKQRDDLQEANTREVDRRRAAETCYSAAADQVHALRGAIGRIAERLARGKFPHQVYVAKDYTKEALVEDLRAMEAGDSKHG